MLFGEREEEKHPSLYFDAEGNLYPSRRISNTDLEKNSGSLKEFYLSNPGVFSEVKLSYQLSENLPMEEALDSLNWAIFSSTLKDSSAFVPTLLIHGFRKSYKKQNADRTSIEDFDSIIASVPKTRPKNFILVYWDGMYDCCFGTKLKENKRIFDAFEEAQLNAQKVGTSLGALLKKSACQQMELLSFSLGAQVVSSAVPSILTSKKEIHFYLIEPAISGKNLQESFSSVDKRNRFHLTIVYNENDFVLKKKDPKFGLLGPGPYKHGATTLGCNYKNDAVFTQQFLEQKKVECNLVDFSFMGKTHREPSYFNPTFSPLIWGY